MAKSIPFLFLSTCLFLCLSFSSTNARSVRSALKGGIPKEFQSINVDNYLKNKRNVEFQLKCLLYNGPCDRIGKFIKETIPEYIQTRCSECEPVHKEKAEQISGFLEKNYPKEWSEAVERFQL